MANEEKALELRNKFNDDIAFHSAIEMAEWKDQQFKGYLEIRRNKIAEIDTKDYKGWEMHYMADITEIINEFFKKK